MAHIIMDQHQIKKMKNQTILFSNNNNKMPNKKILHQMLKGYNQMLKSYNLMLQKDNQLQNNKKKMDFKLCNK